jgi:hypothetical protein
MIAIFFFYFVILLGAVFVIKRLGAPKNLAAPLYPTDPTFEINIYLGA